MSYESDVSAAFWSAHDGQDEREERAAESVRAEQQDADDFPMSQQTPVERRGNPAPALDAE